MADTDPGTLRVLEWDTLCSHLCARAATVWGRARLTRLLPDPDPSVYRAQLVLVGECLDLLRLGQRLPWHRLDEDIEPEIRRSAVEGTRLDGPDLVRVAAFMELVGLLADRAPACEATAPGLSGLLDLLEPAPEFCRAVQKALEADGSIKDSASPQLSKMRRALLRLQGSILSRLETVASSLGEGSVVTLRDGRYVVSVHEHDRGRVPGVVHDRSQSGTTYFVEPLSVLEMGNELRSLEAEIRYEMGRILEELTALLHERAEAALANIERIAELDTLWARASWAERVGAHVPRFTDSPELHLVAARHPLLLEQHLSGGADPVRARASVVPYSLDLDDSCCAVVISGPNTGGKTVCLKAVGLAVVMVQAAVPVPAAPESTVGLFDAVFADIGDEQSLALSLSTFSAHLRRVGAACRQASSASLVLLDELGVGTDPEEGGALARAVIGALVTRGARLLVTTHYNTLKLLSEEDSRIVNAAFMFDEQTLSPTFELVVGRPGQSYALEIARRLEFPEDIVTHAQSGIRDETMKLSRLLSSIAEKEATLTLQEARAAEHQARLEALLAFNQDAREQVRRLRDTAEAEARREAARIVDETRRVTEQLVASIRRSQADRDTVRAAHRELKRLSQRSSPDRTAIGSQPSTPAALSVGMMVTVDGLSTPGEVLHLSDDGQRVAILIGRVTHTVARDRVRPDTRAVSGNKPPRGMRPEATESTAADAYEVDLRGRTVDEARLELEDLLEPLQRQGIRSVRVIHGRGTGVLRRELQNWFRSHPQVESHRRGGPGEGGDGVTVLTLRAV